MRSRPLAAGVELQVHQPAFEGPFDLLIYLVERDQLDIHEIIISDITSSYIESLKLIEHYDPDVASDFIYMAAYLLELKSRSLLPRIQRQHLADEPDPRQELINRLVEYKRFKYLAGRLEQLAVGDGRVFTRRPTLPAGEEGGRKLAPMSLDNLYSAYQRALEKARVEVREISGGTVPVAEKMEFIRHLLCNGPTRFSALVEGADLVEKIATFLALLELVRLGEVSVAQPRLFGPINIQPAKRGAK